MRDVTVDVQRVVRTLLVSALVFEVGLLVLDLVFNYLDVTGDRSIRRIFNVAREQSIPTWFASTQAVAVGCSAAAVGAFQWRDGAWWTRIGWAFTAAFFVYVGIDDAAEIHERVGSAIGRAYEDVDGDFMAQFPSYAWQLFVAPVLALGLFGSVAFVFTQSRSFAVRTALFSCLLCFAVSQGLDFVEGIDGLFDDIADRLKVDDYAVSHSFRGAEEYLEMVGTTSMWAAVLWVATAVFRGSRVLFASEEAQP